jgi:hypothetical protein
MKRHYQNIFPVLYVNSHSAAATPNRNSVTNDQEAPHHVVLDKERHPLLNALAPIHFFAVLRALRLA